jgi:hypothetical protein
MVFLGLLLIILGAIVILSAIFVSDGSAELLGMDLSALTVFLIGVAACASVIWGYSILKYGTKRELKARRERKQLNELSQKLDRVESEQQQSQDEDS